MLNAETGRYRLSPFCGKVDIAQSARKGRCECEARNDRDGGPRREDLENNQDDSSARASP
jgi:hypothetical protein